MKKEIIFIQGVPEKIKRDFKSGCAKRGLSMKTALILFMKLFPKNGFANSEAGQDNKSGDRKVGVNLS